MFVHVFNYFTYMAMLYGAIHLIFEGRAALWEKKMFNKWVRKGGSTMVSSIGWETFSAKK